MGKRWVWTLLLLASVGVLAGLSLWRVSRAVPRLTNFNHVAGTWTALAMDCSEGVFYRPIAGERGYGGTRYMPLHFLMHGALIASGIAPVVAGYMVTLFSATLLFSGTFLLLRRLGANLWLGLAGTFLPLLGAAVQISLASVRGDILAAALTIWGIALAVQTVQLPSGPKAFIWRMLPAVLLFGSAFMTKFTAVFGPVAVMLLFVYQKRWREAGCFAGMMAIALGLFFLPVLALSGGRILENFNVCATGGDSCLRVLIRAPFRFLNRITLAGEMELIFLFVIVGSVARYWKEAGVEFITIALLVSAGATILIFGSPGIDYNHMIEVETMAAVFLIVQVSRSRMNYAAGAVLLSVLILAWSAHFVKYGRHVEDRRAGMLAAIAAIPPGDAPILSENAALPAIMGERIHAIDSSGLRLICLKRPEIGQDFLAGIAQHRYRAILLNSRPDTEEGRARLDDNHFGPGFRDALAADYVFVRRTGGYSLYVPALDPRAISAVYQKPSSVPDIVER